MAIRTLTVTATTTPTQVGTGTDSDGNPYVRDLAIYNDSAAPIYVGGPDVTAANGWPIAAGQSMSFDSLEARSKAYIVTSAGTATVRVLEVGI